MTNCSIVRDLLPLYEDGVVSEETRQDIREHLEECDECRKYRGHMARSAKIMDKVKSSGNYRYSEVVKRIKRTRIVYSVAAAVFAVVTVAGWIAVLVHCHKNKAQ